MACHGGMDNCACKSNLPKTETPGGCVHVCVRLRVHVSPEHARGCVRWVRSWAGRRAGGRSTLPVSLRCRKGFWPWHRPTTSSDLIRPPLCFEVRKVDGDWGLNNSATESEVQDAISQLSNHKEGTCPEHFPVNLRSLFQSIYEA